MIFISSALLTSLLLTQSTATVLVPRQVAPHAVQDGPKGPLVKAREPIPVSNGTVTSQSVPSTITSAPTGWPTYSRQWPPPGCSVPALTLSDWCRVNPGTVQLHYWPTGAAAKNLTYPSTSYLSQYGVMMTSPSVYYAIDVVSATDYCGQLIGPPVTSWVYSLALSDVSTLQIYASVSADKPIGPPLQLQLSDLSSGCPTIAPSDIPMFNHFTTKNPCNPVLEYGIPLKNAVANGAWESCGRFVGGGAGIFDPPVPVTACPGGDCGDIGAGPAPTTTPSAPSSTPTPQPEQEASITSTSSAAPLQTPPQIASATSTSTTAQKVSQSQELPTTSAITTLSGGGVISAAPGGSTIVVGSHTLTAGSAPITTGAEVISIAASVVVVSNTDDGSVTTIPIPAASPVSPAEHSIGVVAGQTISIADIGGSSVIVIQGQTLSLGGPEVTLSAAEVASLGSNGVVIQAPYGVVTTLPILPTPAGEATGQVEKVPATASSGSAGATGVGSIIYATLQGAATKASTPIECGVLGWIALLTIGLAIGL